MVKLSTPLSVCSYYEGCVFDFFCCEGRLAAEPGLIFALGLNTPPAASYKAPPPSHGLLGAAAELEHVRDIKHLGD